MSEARDLVGKIMMALINDLGVKESCEIATERYKCHDKIVKGSVHPVLPHMGLISSMKRGISGWRRSLVL